MGFKLPRKGNKYGARKTKVGDRTFDSKAEAMHYLTLKALERAEAISELECQVTFDLEVSGVLVCKYRADFCFCRDGAYVVQDVKGYRTAEYKIKKKLMKAVYNIDIEEV